MITRKERAFLSRNSLGFLFILSFILSYYGLILSLTVIYILGGLISFFIHSSIIAGSRRGFLGVVFLSLSLILGIFPLISSALWSEESRKI